MSLWTAILLGSAIAFVTKLVGFLVPVHHLEHPRVSRLAGVMTIGLLSSLVADNTFTDPKAIVVDARVVSLGAAAVALALRAPFIVVVIVGAAAAALVRYLGWLP